jgi:hypothetical protein
MSEVIGILRLREAREYRKSYETASWFKRIMVPAGDYELSASSRADHKGNFPEGASAYWVYATLTGEIIESHFPSSFAGNPTGGGSFNDDLGEQDSVLLQMYGYNVARDIVEHPYSDRRYILSPGFQVQQAGYESTTTITALDGSSYCVKVPAWHVVKTTADQPVAAEV